MLLKSKFKYILKKNAGFSLIEISLVIAIIGIIALISAPIYRRISPNLNLNSTTRDISSDLRYAQQLAVSEQVNYAVIFDTVQNNYTIVNTDSGTTIKSKDINNQILIYNITDLTNDTVNFNVTGAATESGQITLINSQDITSTIAIKPSGYVKIQ